MLSKLKTLGRFAVLVSLCSMTAAVSALAQDDSLLLIDPSSEPNSEAPELLPPQTEATLPPPQPPAERTRNRLPAKQAVRRPFMRPATPKQESDVPAELTGDVEAIPVPDAAMGELRVLPAPPIKYDTDSDARRMYRHSGQIELVMVTQNPSDGCYYEIPLCIPACCVGEPTVSGGQGIFGRGVVEYCWPSCGFRAIVKFRHILGDVRVDYEGD